MIERSKDLDLCLFKTDIFWCGILASRLALMESLCGLRLNVVSAKVPRAIPVVSKSSATKVSLQYRDLDAFNLGEVQVRRVYPDIFDACSATCERENLNSIINLNFMFFPAKNFILNSNFAAHRWRCKHQKHLDRLFLLELRPTHERFIAIRAFSSLNFAHSEL